MEPLQNGNETSPLQHLLIGAGALIVVVLTVVGAIFLAMQDLPQEDEATPTAAVSLSPTASVVNPTTPAPTPPTFTPTATVADTETPVPAATFTDTPEPPPVETTQVPPTETPVDTVDTPTATNTSETPPTSTPVPSPPTATATPAELTNCGTPPPPGWNVAYTVQENEDLESIALRSGTSVFDVQQKNCMRDNNPEPGTVIYLPATPATVTPVPTSTAVPTRGPTPTRTGTPVAPRIISVIARQTDSEIIVIVEGENLRTREQGFRAELVGPTVISLNLGQARTNSSFEASAPIPADLPDTLPRGAYDLVVINPGGQLDTREGVFPPSNATPTATPAPPVISQVSPSAGSISEDVRLTVQGSNFRPLEPGFKVEIQSDDGTLSVELPVNEDDKPATSTSFDVIISAGDLVVGTYDLLVSNPDGQTDIERDAYDAIE